jgi:excisionase family DNA binding protein
MPVTDPSAKPNRASNAQFVGRIRAAQLLDVSPQTIDKFIRSGRLRAYRIGRKVIVRKDELLRLVEANEIQ